MSISIFFDLDGVLADFVGGALAVHNRTDVPIKDVPWGLEEKLGIAPVHFWAPMGYEFWRDLRPLGDGMKLLSCAMWMLGGDHIGLLTSPCQTAGCVEGKVAWVKRHLPEFSHRLFIGSAKHLFAGPTKILVDDRDKNCTDFREAGGMAVLVPRPWNDRKSESDADGQFSLSEMDGEIAYALEAMRRE